MSSNRESRRNDSGCTLGRRDFLKLAGAGIFVFFTVGDLPFGPAEADARELPSDFNAFLKIGEDGRVSCYTGKIEMGQGIVTSLAMMLADELDVALESVDMVMGDTELCPWDRGTFGSLSTRAFGPHLRMAAAEARAVLLELAAERLGVPAAELATADGAVFRKDKPGNRVGYAELTRGRRIERTAPSGVSVKESSAFKIMHTPKLRRDSYEKVTGKAQYAGDIQLPGMLYASILRPPAHGAKLLSVDSTEAEAVDGVRVVRDGDLVAVLHARPDVAEAALRTAKAEYERRDMDVDHETIFDHLVQVAPAGDTLEQGGDLAVGEEAAAHHAETTYLDGYVAHAPIEPHTATVQIEGDRVTVWPSSQTPFRAQEEVAQALGMPSENVHIISPFLGGGFGGKTRNLQVVEAARLAKIASAPVQVAWSRSDEFFHDSFRPAAVVTVRSGATEEGRLAYWDYGVYFAGDRGAPHFYDIPHHATTMYGGLWGVPDGVHPFAVGAWRAPANNTNTFARESQMDIMAAQVGVDPLEFRLRNLKDEKMKRVLHAAADKFGWKSAPAPSRQGRGIACGTDAGTYVATIAELELDEDTGGVTVKRIVCAQDMGLCVNPEGAIIQMEGCITMGLGYALTEEVHFSGGEVLDRNFDTYELPRFSWVPEIETVIVEALEDPPQGGGEPAIITMGGAIANAIFDACGARVLQLPMTPARVKAALAEAT